MSDEPTSNWNHSHAIQEGDVFSVDKFGVEMEVIEVRENGDAIANMCPDGVGGDEKIAQEYTEEELTNALADGLWERTDGKSHELATY